MLPQRDTSMSIVSFVRGIVTTRGYGPEGWGKENWGVSPGRSVGLWQHYQGSLGGRECMWIECSDPWYSLTSQGTLGAPDGRARPICSGPCMPSS